MIVVRPAQEVDALVLAELLQDLDLFYGVTDFPPLNEQAEQIAAVLFTDPAPASVLLAEDDGKAVGLASFSFLWPAAGVTLSLYLKELYVVAGARGSGIGRRLMEELQRIGVARGCSRIEWTTDRDNEDAQAFYSRLGSRCWDRSCSIEFR